MAAERSDSGPPLVSVVLPTHNRPHLLDEAVASVIGQSFDRWELIVVDDASSPPVDAARWSGLPGQVRSLRSDIARGGAASKAMGARAARGQFVVFLDDDDLFDPTLLARAVVAFERNPDIEVLFLGVDWFGGQAQASAADHADSMQRVTTIAAPAAVAAEVWLFDQRLVDALLTAVPMDFQRAMVRIAVLDRIGHHRAGCLLWDCDWALRAALGAKCALLRARLYRQRADGQEYFSRPGRELAQMESALEMTLRLYREPPAAASPRTRTLLRQAASRHARDLAYFHSVHGPVASSLAAWWCSQRLRPGLASARLPLAALARAARRRWRQPA